MAKLQKKIKKRIALARGVELKNGDYCKHSKLRSQCQKEPCKSIRRNYEITQMMERTQKYVIAPIGNPEDSN